MSEIKELRIRFNKIEDLLTNFEKLRRQLNEGYTSGDLLLGWSISDYEEKDMREIIKDILQMDICKSGRLDEGFDKEDIDEILFSLGFKVNQKVILL